MKSKLAKSVAVLTVAGLMAAGPMAYAVSEGSHPEGGKGYKQEGGPKFQELTKDLNLTPEQKEKLETQRKAKMESHKAERAQMKAKIQALHEEISKPGTKRADVNGLVAEANALRAQMFSQMVDGIFAMKDVLTPEQFAKMQEKHKGWMNKHEGSEEKNQGPDQN